jgi:hypothetical protein
MKIKLQQGKLITRFIEKFQGDYNEIATSWFLIDDIQSMNLFLITLVTFYQPFISTHGHDTILFL